MFLRLVYLCGLYLLPVYISLSFLFAGEMSKRRIMLFCLFFFAITYLLDKKIGNKVLYIPLVAIVGIACCFVGVHIIGENIMFFFSLFVQVLIVTLIYSAGMVFYRALKEVYLKVP